MKTIEELNASKVPIVIIDKLLDKLDNVVLFPEKVEKAKETITKIGLLKSRSTASNNSIVDSEAASLPDPPSSLDSP